MVAVCRPQDYDVVLSDFWAGQGTSSPELRRSLAAVAFARTAAYDSAIARWFQRGDLLPEILVPAFDRVLELLAFARNNVVTRAMLLKHLYRRADDQPQPKIIDVFISKLRKKLRNASGGAEFIETIPQRGWILRDIDATSGA